MNHSVVIRSQFQLTVNPCCWCLRSWLNLFSLVCVLFYISRVKYIGIISC